MTSIKDIIKKKGHTIKGLCETIGMDRSYFYKSIKSPTYATLNRIACALHITLEELTDEMEDKQSKTTENTHFVATVYKNGKGWRAFSLQELKEVIKEIEEG